MDNVLKAPNKKISQIKTWTESDISKMVATAILDLAKLMQTFTNCSLKRM